MAEEVRIAFQVPEALEGGAYSNVVSVWHTPHEFTLDFATLPPTPQETPEGMVVPCRVVSRIKMPTTVVFDLIRAINENMTTYEQTFGEIQRPNPQPPGEGEGGD